MILSISSPRPPTFAEILEMSSSAVRAVLLAASILSMAEVTFAASAEAISFSTPDMVLEADSVKVAEIPDAAFNAGHQRFNAAGRFGEIIRDFFRIGQNFVDLGPVHALEKVLGGRQR